MLAVVASHDDQRYGMISVRINRAERKQLMEMKAARDCRSLSDVIRLMLGFPRATNAESPLAGSDDIESVDRLCELVVRMIDRQDTGNKAMTRLLKYFGIQDSKDIPVAQLSAPLSTEPDGPERAPRNGSAHHPALPDGFSR